MAEEELDVLGFAGALEERSTSDKRRSAAERRMWRKSFRCGNPFVNEYLASGAVKFDRAQVGCWRMEEHEHLVSALSRSYHGNDLADRLRNCRLGDRSNLMFSLLCRSVREQLEFTRAEQVFAAFPQTEMAFETTIISAFVAYSAEAIADWAKDEIGKFKRKMRNFSQREAAQRPWINEIKKIGYFEIEPYPMDQLRDVMQQSDSKGRRKARLLIKHLGLDINSIGTVWVLHYHAIINVKKKKAYGRLLRKENMFPGKWRVLIKRFERKRDKTANLRRLIGYMLKVAPYYGRLLRPKDKRSILHRLDLEVFVRVYAILGFQTMKGHFGVQ